MDNKQIKSSKAVKQLTDEEIRNVDGGMKVIAEEAEKSWWQTIVDLFFKIKS